jgi:hypothetical protein
MAVPEGAMSCHQCHQYVTTSVTSRKYFIFYHVTSVTSCYARAHVRGRDRRLPVLGKYTEPLVTTGDW